MLTVCDTTCRQQRSVRRLARSRDVTAVGNSLAEIISSTLTQTLWRLVKCSCEKVPARAIITFWSKVDFDYTYFSDSSWTCAAI